VTSVAVLGTGRMGGAMAGTLRRAGLDVVVWNRTRAKADQVAGAAGARVVETVGEAVAAADFVLSSLADDAAVEAVYDEVVGGLRQGQLALEMSTIAPRTVRGIAARIADRGAVLLDAPVSGSVSLVEAGTLTIMVGGDAAALERARPVLEPLSSKILHVGAVGAGATMKLAVNALVHGLNVALAESLVLAERAGVERTTAYEVFASGAAGAPFVQYKRAAYERPDETPVAFSLDLVAKDLDLILELADEVGAPMRQGAANREEVREAVAAGLGTRDLSAIAELLRRVAGSRRS
jgi:3-hydroxyisobutyrate dehydrogenase/2-hydroxy-3-oxopropionate reductase